MHQFFFFLVEEKERRSKIKHTHTHTQIALIKEWAGNTHSLAASLQDQLTDKNGT